MLQQLQTTTASIFLFPGGIHLEGSWRFKKAGTQAPT